MDAFVMDMNGYSIEQDAAADEYGDEVMEAGWNPQLVQASQNPVAPTDRHVELPAGLVNADIDGFLKRMYEYQC